jgi:diguanylate cyclase (GGDEF)-like protein
MSTDAGTSCTFVGLPDRNRFLTALRAAMNAGPRDPAKATAVLFVGVDRFKHVNYSLGHEVGDALLCAIANVLCEVMNRAVAGDLCRPTLAHLGGDEFAVLLEGLAEASDATRIARAILDTIETPFSIDGQEIYSSVSIGVAFATGHGERPEELLCDADTAMARAKAFGRGLYVVYEPGMRSIATTALRTETDLRRALQEDELCVHYQPIVALRSSKITGFEALVRWQHPAGPIIGPGEYIPVAEATGLIIPIDRLVLRAACRQLHQWQDRFKAGKRLTMSVNISGLQFTRPDFIVEIDRALRESGIYGSSLRLEITESVVVEKARYAPEILEQLKAFGIRLSVDDFGTGYSSLAYLRSFDIDTLKIDRSFVASMERDNDSWEIIRTIVTLGNNLSKGVVAEGIETRHQRELLLALRCGHGQGYLFSPPVDADAATDLLEAEEAGTFLFDA